LPPSLLSLPPSPLPPSLLSLPPSPLPPSLHKPSACTLPPSLSLLPPSLLPPPSPRAEVRMETGKGKCPFEPSQHYTAVMAGGILYTAATSNFLGTMFDISRATGPEQGRIRTERSINWLNDPEFVSASFIQQDPTSEPLGDDDKLYFFFTEVAKEYEMYTKVKVPRVARVCKSDVGGMKTLQRRWTTFLKAQLVCEDRPSGQRYNVLTDVFTLRRDPNDPATTQFYGLFTSQWEREELAAVCVFSLSDINKVMDGPFKELKKTCENWINPEPVPRPRPGQVLDDFALRAEGFESSLKLPDKVLTFTRDHPLMENSVTAAPLLLRRGVTYTKLAVTLADGGAGALLHLGTDRGEIHRVAVVGQNTTLLQEVPLFPADQPINNIVLHKVETHTHTHTNTHTHTHTLIHLHTHTHTHTNTLTHTDTHKQMLT
uniref:Sema domain-containing protein n=1 Tax=Gadus morhua TaxID=8049 RepID=A0A8C4ZK19_GADMO